ncbi:MAG: hypothetical protein H6509_09275 [Bryobacterales bacterium]|nr:hypothetical protein [Acidobacteriota bacterium]MCB9384795.1 hypothetical protein [Bryobacterales bacterium]
MHIDLSPSEEAALARKAQAEGLSVEGLIRKLANENGDGERPSNVGEEGLGAMIRRIVGDPPAEELEKLPTDLASQTDHYLYGAPKR